MISAKEAAALRVNAIAADFGPLMLDEISAAITAAANKQLDKVDYNVDKLSYAACNAVTDILGVAGYSVDVIPCGGLHETDGVKRRDAILRITWEER